MRNLDELAPEPTERSCDTGQLIPCFDSCQLTILWMSIIKLNTRYRPPHQLERLTFHIGFPVVRTDGRTHSHMITKISQVDRLPNFHRHVARACVYLHYYNPNLGSHVSSVWNFCTHSSDLIQRGNQRLLHEKVAIFSG